MNLFSVFIGNISNENELKYILVFSNVIKICEIKFYLYNLFFRRNYSIINVNDCVLKGYLWILRT